MNPPVPNISVIVPVHNTERWVGRCIDSILSQSCTDFELILVEDGSTDDSGTICDEYAARDARIRVAHIPNGGVSNARNRGLDFSQGRFICFIDSDDWVERDYLATLLETLTNSQAQIGICGISSDPNSNEPPVVLVAPTQTLTLLSVNADELLTLYESYLLFGPYNKIYERMIINANKLRFDTTLSYGEDLVFNFQYLDSVAQLAVSDQPLYHYRKANPGSLAGKYHADKFQIDMRLFEVTYAFFEKHGLLTVAALCWLWTRYFWSLHDDLFLINHPRCTLRWPQKFQHIRAILAHPRLPEALVFADTTKCPRSILACIRHQSVLGFFALNLVMSLKNRGVPS
ncbi:MAG: glycosyltransferase family 2 protein [Holophagaceae bacterium]|nr:glycosyltransferase family 2 protein [Holophagaceae bacterium]